MSNPIVLDGLALSKTLRAKLKDSISVDTSSKPPTLAVLLCTNDPASELYVQKKREACAEVGINSLLIRPFEGGIQSYTNARDHLCGLLDWLSDDRAISGILLQVPLPPELVPDKYEIFDRIHPNKDVDGLNSVNVARLVQGRSAIKPCTPQAVVALLVHYGIDLPGKRVTIINRGDIVGKPLANMLIQNQGYANATVCLCHDNTPVNVLVESCRWADIIVVAVGKRDFLTAEMVGPGKVIVDVGINRDGKKLYGDCSADLYDISAAYTPVPGGVGPMTITCLLENTLICRSKSPFYNPKQ